MALKQSIKDCILKIKIEMEGEKKNKHEQVCLNQISITGINSSSLSPSGNKVSFSKQEQESFCLLN